VGSHNGGTGPPTDSRCLFVRLVAGGSAYKPPGVRTRPRKRQTYDADGPGAQRRVGGDSLLCRKCTPGDLDQASLLVVPEAVTTPFRPIVDSGRSFGRAARLLRLASGLPLRLLPLISGAPRHHDRARTIATQGSAIYIASLLCSRSLGIDPEVFPIYLGLPGESLGPLPQISLPAQIHTRVCRRSCSGERTGHADQRDRPMSEGPAIARGAGN